MSDLITRIEAYLNQLSPHMHERMGNKLLRESLEFIKTVPREPYHKDRTAVEASGGDGNGKSFP